MVELVEGGTRKGMDKRIESVLISALENLADQFPGLVYRIVKEEYPFVTYMDNKDGVAMTMVDFGKKIPHDYDEYQLHSNVLWFAFNNIKKWYR